jgi:thymidine phosphorylase
MSWAGGGCGFVVGRFFQRAGSDVRGRERDDAVEEGETILELHAPDEKQFAAAEEALREAFDISSEPPERRPLVIERVA